MKDEQPSNKSKRASQTRKAPQRKGAKLPEQGLAKLAEILAHLRIVDWDAVIIGDGSGGSWDVGAGFAGVLVDRASGAAKLCYGAWNTGTVTVAEMMPYIELMVWYTSKDGPGRQRRREAAAAGRTMNVHIITDSDTIARCGRNPGSRKAYRELWAAMDAYGHNGYRLHYHHISREITNLNVLVDQVSRQARLDVKETFDRAVASLRKRYPGIPGNTTIYDWF